MPLKINYKNNLSKKKSQNLVLFVDDSFNLNGIKKHILKTEYSYINDLVRNRDKKKKIITYQINSKKKLS